MLYKLILTIQNGPQVNKQPHAHTADPPFTSAWLRHQSRRLRCLQNSSFLRQNSLFLVHNSLSLVHISSFLVQYSSCLTQNSSFLLTVVHSLPIESNVESLRWFERVPVEEVAAAAMRKSICEPSVGGRATHHDHDGSVPVYLDVSDK